MTRSPSPQSRTGAGSARAIPAAPGGCRPRPPLAERLLLPADDAGALERVFKVLASGARIRLLHELVRRPGMAVTELAQAVGMKPQAVSNQLQRMADKGVVSSVRNGTSIHYRVVDPCVVALIDLCLCLVKDARDRLARLDTTTAAGPPSGENGRTA